MHADIQEAILVAKSVRDRVLKKDLSVKEANAASSANGQVILAHALDLRERIFAVAGPKLSNRLSEAPTIEGTRLS